MFLLAPGVYYRHISQVPIAACTRALRFEPSGADRYFVSVSKPIFVGKFASNFHCLRKFFYEDSVLFRQRERELMHILPFADRKNRYQGFAEFIAENFLNGSFFGKRNQLSGEVDGDIYSRHMSDVFQGETNCPDPVSEETETTKAARFLWGDNSFLAFHHLSPCKFNTLFCSVGRFPCANGNENIHDQQSTRYDHRRDFGFLFPLWGVVRAAVGTTMVSFGRQKFREAYNGRRGLLLCGNIFWLYGFAGVITWLAS